MTSVCLHAYNSSGQKVDVTTEEAAASTRQQRWRKQHGERMGGDTHTLADRRGGAVVAASLPLVNLFFILFRLRNNERTEPIQFLRSKRGPPALTVPESLGPGQRFLSRAPCTATSTTAQFTGWSRATAPAWFNCTRKWSVQHAAGMSIGSKQLYPSNLNPALIIVCSCSF